MYTVREDKVGVSALMSSEPHKTGHYVECSDELLQQVIGDIPMEEKRPALLLCMLVQYTVAQSVFS